MLNPLPDDAELDPTMNLSIGRQEVVDGRTGDIPARRTDPYVAPRDYPHSAQVNRLTKEELTYELRVRGLGDGSNLTVAELRTVLRNALQLEKTSLAIKSPAYPYTFNEDSAALSENVEAIDKLISEFSGSENDSKYKGITSKIAHSLGRVNRSSPQNETEKGSKAEIRLKLLLAFDKLKEKTKRERRSRDSTALDLSVLRHNTEPPGAHSSELDNSSDSSENEESVVKTKPVPVRDWGLKFTGKRIICHLVLFLNADAVDLFEGDAYTWYNMVKDWATDWNSLVGLMREQFLPETFDRDLFEEIKRKTQGDHESIGLYIASMKWLFNKMTNPVAEETQFEIIMERIDPYYQPFIAFAQISTITELLTACRKLDVKRELAKSFKPPPAKNKSLIPELAYAIPPSSPVELLILSPIELAGNVAVLTICRRGALNREGDIVTRAVTQMSLFELAQIAQKGRGNGQWRHYVLAHAQGDERPYVTVSIFGKELLGLLDSGASRTIIGYNGWELLKNIGLINLEESDCASITVANGNTCSCIGVLRTPVKLRDIEKIIDILVVPDLNHTLILGIDFWLRMGIVPNFSSNEWKFSLSNSDVQVITDRWYNEMRDKAQADPLHFPNWRVLGSFLYKYVDCTFSEVLDEDKWKRVIPKTDIATLLAEDEGRYLEIRPQLRVIRKDYYLLSDTSASPGKRLGRHCDCEG
ncbi:hypothetical protein NQ317_015360 [Molorchus minor]|uniref:Retrotransposon gag domain-containing protein n=1 Tax=Molorchus minor TaxID=1323400 RepID=A0ABQ9J735_9CUCU|nr:hypothetical protein NQ317_015360 [Molorchus minor]